MATSGVQTPPIPLKDRIAAFQQRNVSPSSTTSSKTPSPSSGSALRDKIARFEQKGGIPVPRGSFGLGAVNPDNSQARRSGELYGNRVPGLSHPNGPPMSRSGSPLPAGSTEKSRRFSISNIDLDFAPSPNYGHSSPVVSEPEESPTSSPIPENSPRRSPNSRRSSFANALDAARRRESLDLSKFDFDQGFPSSSPSPTGRTRYLPHMPLVEDREEEVGAGKMEQLPLENTASAPKIVVSSEEDPSRVTLTTVTEPTVSASPQVETDAELFQPPAESYPSGVPCSVLGKPSSPIPSETNPHPETDAGEYFKGKPLSSSVGNSPSAVSDSSVPSTTQHHPTKMVTRLNREAEGETIVSPSLVVGSLSQPARSPQSSEDVVEAARGQDGDSVERTPRKRFAELDMSDLPPDLTRESEAPEMESPTLASPVVPSPSVTMSEGTTAASDNEHVKSMDDVTEPIHSVETSPGNLPLPIPTLSVSRTPISLPVDISPPHSPLSFGSPALGRQTPSSDVSATPSLTPTVSMFEASEVSISHAHRVSHSTGTAVKIPATTYLHEDEEFDESDYGSVSILTRSQPSLTIPPHFSEPDFSTISNPASQYFKAVVHGKVTERGISTIAMPRSAPQVTKTRRLTKTGDSQSSGQGDLAILLANAARLEKSLVEGHIPSEESEGEGHSTDMQSPSDQNNTTDDDAGSGGEHPLPPPPKSFRTTRYISNSFRKLKKTGTNVLRTIPGGHPRKSLSTSSEMSSEDSSPVVTPPGDPGRDAHFQGIGWPSMSPRKHTLSRASSFADKVLHRTRTKSSASSLDMSVNSVARGRAPPLAPILVPPVPLLSESKRPLPPPKDNPPPPVSPHSPSLSPNLPTRPKSWMSGASTSSSMSGPLVLDNNVFDAFPSVPKEVPPSPSHSASVFPSSPSLPVLLPSAWKTSQGTHASPHLTLPRIRDISSGASATISHKPPLSSSGLRQLFTLDGRISPQP